jgi:phage terminase small subunit
MKQPRNLDTEAKAFYRRHSKRLKDQGLLTDSTHDSFVLLARTHSILASLDPHDTADKMAIIKYIGVSKIYQALSRGFAMNSDKPRVAQMNEPKDEYGL